MIHGVLFIPAPKILQIQGKERREAGRLREEGEGKGGSEGGEGEGRGRRQKGGNGVSI
jgi:hypothetical protein